MLFKTSNLASTLISESVCANLWIKSSGNIDAEITPQMGIRVFTFKI